MLSKFVVSLSGSGGGGATLEDELEATLDNELEELEIVEDAVEELDDIQLPGKHASLCWIVRRGISGDTVSLPLASNA